MDISEICQRAISFNAELLEQKASLAVDFSWYPYGTLNNFYLLDQLLTGRNRELLELCRGGVVDIGAADGDTAFFMETLGIPTNVVDYAPTNFNSCRGLHALRKARNSAMKIAEVDLDALFELPDERYGLAFFLGILYHLKNPYFALEQLAKKAKHALVSTRIASHTPPSAGGERVELRNVPVAYLLGPDECNNDSTNYWIFSETGLRRVLDRAGWDVLDLATFGSTSFSDPSSADGDERAFCLIRSRVI